MNKKNNWVILFTQLLKFKYYGIETVSQLSSTSQILKFAG